MNIDKIIVLVKNCFVNNKYSIEYVNIQKNSINGIVYTKETKYFFKVLNNEEMQKELYGYSLIKEKYPVSIIKEIFYFNEFRYYTF